MRSAYLLNTPKKSYLLKGYFSRGIPKDEFVSQSRTKRRERGLWQRRFWAHMLIDQDDFNVHFD